MNGGSAESQNDDSRDDGIAGENTCGGDFFDDGGVDEAGAGTGGHEIENTNEAVAGAEAGDTLTRDDGTEVTITQGDIDWAQDYCDTHGISYGKEEETADEFFASDDSGAIWRVKTAVRLKAGEGKYAVAQKKGNRQAMKVKAG